MAELTVQKLKGYIGAGLNVAITGVHGVGKTAKLKEAVNQLGYSMKYYSAATLDPYTDLTGIPVPDIENRVVHYFRPKGIEDADVIFFDEFNRADPKTLNTLLEIILERAVNGEKLDKLKAVVVAMNPVTDEYTTDEIDHAILDRFDVFLTAEPEIELGYFVKKFGDRVGKAAVELWNDNQKRHLATKKTAAAGNQTAYISPRRMEKIVTAFLAIPTKETIKDCLPPEVVDYPVVATNFYNALSRARNLDRQEVSVDGVRPAVMEIINSPISVQRSAATGRAVTRLIEQGTLNNEEKARLLSSLSIALQSGKSPKSLMEHFGPAIRIMSDVHMKSLISNWDARKANELRDLLAK